MSDLAKNLVFWLDPWAWDKDMDIVALDRRPETVDHWLEFLHQHGWKIMLLPYDARIHGGPCDGGHVVAVETGEGRQYAAVPPAAVSALRTELPESDFQALVKATPALSPASTTSKDPSQK